TDLHPPPCHTLSLHDALPISISLRDAPLRTALETLFQGTGLQHAVEPAVPNFPITLDVREVPFSTALRTLLRLAPGVTYRKEGRSEEHTSELQSLAYLVCRLL